MRRRPGERDQVAGGSAAVKSPALPKHGSGTAIDVRIATFEPMRVACIRDVGAWPDVRRCLQRLLRWAATLDAPTGRMLTLSFERTEEVPAQRWYWNAGVEMFTHERPPPGIEFDTLGAGRHAVHRLVGPQDEIGEAYRRLFEEWLPGSGETVAERPCMELYRNTVAEVVAKRLITDLCVPLLEPDPD